MYRIDIRKDGAVVDSFEIPAEYVIELMAWSRKNASEPRIAGGADDLKEAAAPGAVAPAGKIRYCSKCSKPGHRSDTCRDEEGLGPTKPKFEEAAHRAIEHVDASAYIRLRAKHKQGIAKSDICDDEEVTLAQLNAVLESSSWVAYSARIAH